MSEEAVPKDRNNKKVYCLYVIWPYTENNICVLEKHHEGNHKDARGREFDNVTYIKNKEIP